MSKKMMVLALAVVSVAICALPAMAAAQEIHLESGENFTIAGPGYEGRTEGEPAFACASTGGSGKFDVGSTTTGAATLDLTGCYTILFGMKFNCMSEGSEFPGTIATGGTFHLITVSSGAPGLLLTTNKTVVSCGSRTTWTGSFIVTIISPKCGGSSNSLSLSFTAIGSTPTDLTYTGVKYDLLAKTELGEGKTAALAGNATYTQATAGKLNCT